jgi:hypothetical protein
LRHSPTFPNACDAGQEQQALELERAEAAAEQAKRKESKAAVPGYFYGENMGKMMNNQWME